MITLYKPTNTLKKVFCTLIIIFTYQSIIAQQLAFPSAYGAGAYATGGRGGTVIHVTTLANDGPGSFREALESTISPRYIVFDVSGVIHLTDHIYMSGVDNGAIGNFTVNGFSAPMGGITIVGKAIRLHQVHNVIWRGLRFRNGYLPAEPNYSSNISCIGIRASNNVIVDRCSFAYAKSKGVDISTSGINEYAEKITIQNNLIGNTVQAMLVGNSAAKDFGNASVLRNVISNTGWRHPKAGGEIKLDVINNISHNWRGRTIRMDGYDYKLNVIGNYYQGGTITGIAQRSDKSSFATWTNATMNPQIWDEDNFIDSENRPTNYPEQPITNWHPFATSTLPVKSEWFVNSRLPLQGRPIPILSSADLKDELLPRAGACEYIADNGTVQFYRDSLDESLINYVQTDMPGTYVDSNNYASLALSIINTMPSATRPSNFYINNPHIPEVWFSANVPIGQDHNDISPNGYTWLEEYLNQIDYNTMLIAAQGVEVTPNLAEVEMNSTLQLGATYTPLNATNQEGVWSSSNEDIATVDSNGEVTGISVGEVIITYTTNDGGYIGTSQITVFPEALDASASEDQIICEGDTITLTASGGTSYLWNTGETTETIVVTPSQTSIYTVLVSDDYEQSEEVGVEVTVNQAPIVDIGEDQTICQGESITLTANGGDTYLWSTGETTEFIEVSPNSETVYNVEVFSGTCSSIDSVTIFVRDAPDITVSDDVVIVEGDSTTLAVNGSDNYLWSTGEITAFINVAPAITTIYEVVSTNSNGCSTRLEVTVTVIPEVIADAGTDTAICRDETVTLTATGGGSYLWNTGDTSAELMVSPIVTTTYTVTVEDDYGYTDTDSVTITVNETPDITVSDDIIIVEGESTTLIAEGGSNYQWNTGDTTSELIVNPLLTTTYTVISVADGGCADIEQVVVTVIPEVIADAGEDISICSGETVTITATGGVTYLWNTGETADQFEITPLVTTTYTVTVEDDYGYTDTDSVTITVNQTPDITVSDDIIIMDGDSTILTANGGNNYLWNTNETTAEIIVNPTITTTYTVSSFGDGGCNDTEEVTVTVIPEVAAYAGEDVTICSGESVILTAAGGGTYLWNTGELTPQIEVTPIITTTYTIIVEDEFGNTDADSVTITVNQTPEIIVSDNVTIMDGDSTTLTANGGDNYLWNTNETTAEIIVSPTETTTYTVTSIGVGGCADIEEVTVTVVPELVANAGPDEEICNGDSIILNASGGIAYTWSTGDTGSQLIVNPTITTTYTVIVEDIFGSSDSDSVTVTVNELPDVTVSDDVLIMTGESTILTASGSNNYQWNNGETTSSITVNPSSTTTYSVSTFGDGGCEDSEQVTVTVIPELIANAGEDITICSGEIITLYASGGETYLWDTGETSPEIEVSPLTTTTYILTVANTYGYTDTDSVTVTVNETPNITISENITITEGESTSLVVSGAETYLWNNGATFSTIVVSPTETTTYIVLGVSNSCIAEAQVTVTVEEPFSASAGQDERVCSNDTYEVVLTANQGDSYLWSTGETTQTIIVSPLSTTTYSVTVTQGAQEDTDDVTVYVDPNPDVVIVNGDSVDIMNGDFITLSATGANTYEWSNGASQPNIAVSPSTTTTYEVKGYAGDCYDEKQVTVNVIPAVEADAGDDVNICLGEVATLTATGGDEYEWSTGETTQTIEVSPTVTTQYTVTVFNALDFDEDSVIVMVDNNCEEDEEEDDEEVEIPIGEELDFDFNIFPNPASDIVNIRLSGSINLTKVYLYDITGKLIHKVRISNDNLSVSSTIEIDVSQLLPGMYYIKMVDINKEVSKKLIVK